MKILSILLLFLVGCSSVPVVKSVKEATEDNDLKTGLYKNSKGENLHITVVNAKERLDELEKNKRDSAREIEYLKKENQKLREQNLILKSLKGYKIEEEKVSVVGFDKEHNPVVKKEMVNLEPDHKIVIDITRR